MDDETPCSFEMAAARKPMGVPLKGNKPSTKAAAGKGKAAAASLKEFGECRFDFLSACRHNLKSAADRCPLCKLASYTTNTFFADEAEQRRKNKEESLRNRALLRVDLLSHWDRCQCLYYVDIEENKCSQLFLSKSLLNVICNSEDLVRQYAAKPIDFTNLEQILQRRNRMFEAGHLAALYLQARVRRFLTRRRVRLILLDRFEYVAADKRTADFFVDNWKQHKWMRYPKLLHLEPPGTPRTIRRRLNHEHAVHSKRLDAFRASLAKHQEHSGQLDIFSKEEGLVEFYKQLVVLRDSIAIAMARMRKIVSESDEAGTGTATGPFAIWMLPSAPAMSSRQLGISLALQHLPSPAGRTDVATHDQEHGPGKPSASSGAPVNTINRTLQILEQASLNALCCVTPEEVVQKLLQPDLLPLYASVLNIAQDEYAVWNGDVEYNKAVPERRHVDSPTNASGGSAGMGVGAGDETLDHVPGMVGAWEVLPFGVQLRPFMNRQSSGLFRVFFYDEEFIAASAVSPWAFYPEVRTIAACSRSILIVCNRSTRIKIKY